MCLPSARSSVINSIHMVYQIQFFQFLSLNKPLFTSVAIIHFRGYVGIRNNKITNISIHSLIKFHNVICSSGLTSI